MTQSRLILLEGIPGSGKSSAGDNLQRFLEGCGKAVRFWREGNFDHPADFEGVACLPESQYQDIQALHPELTGLLDEQLTVQGNDYLLWYRKLQHLHPQQIPPSLVDELSRYDVYDGLPMQEYCRLALQRWCDFERAAQESGQITILECCFLQNPLTVMLARHNAKPDVAEQHIIQIVQIIQNLNPLLIYLSPCNARAALEHIRAERPKEWADFVTGYLTGQEYGKAHGLKGYEGVIQFYEMRQEMELHLLKRLPVRSRVIEHSGTEWECCQAEIVGFIHPFV